MAILSDFVFC